MKNFKVSFCLFILLQTVAFSSYGDDSDQAMGVYLGCTDRLESLTTENMTKLFALFLRARVDRSKVIRLNRHNEIATTVKPTQSNSRNRQLRKTYEFSACATYYALKIRNQLSEALKQKDWKVYFEAIFIAKSLLKDANSKLIDEDFKCEDITEIDIDCESLLNSELMRYALGTTWEHPEASEHGLLQLVHALETLWTDHYIEEILTIERRRKQYWEWGYLGVATVVGGGGFLAYKQLVSLNGPAATGSAQISTQAHQTANLTRTIRKRMRKRWGGGISKVGSSLSRQLAINSINPRRMIARAFLRRTVVSGAGGALGGGAAGTLGIQAGKLRSGEYSDGLSIDQRIKRMLPSPMVLMEFNADALDPVREEDLVKDYANFIATFTGSVATVALLSVPFTVATSYLEFKYATTLRAFRLLRLLVATGKGSVHTVGFSLIAMWLIDTVKENLIDPRILSDLDSDVEQLESQLANQIKGENYFSAYLTASRLTNTSVELSTIYASSYHFPLEAVVGQFQRQMLCAAYSTPGKNKVYKEELLDPEAYLEPGLGVEFHSNKFLELKAEVAKLKRMVAENMAKAEQSLADTKKLLNKKWRQNEGSYYDEEACLVGSDCRGGDSSSLLRVSGKQTFSQKMNAREAFMGFRDHLSTHQAINNYYYHNDQKFLEENWSQSWLPDFHHIVTTRRYLEEESYSLNQRARNGEKINPSEIEKFNQVRDDLLTNYGRPLRCMSTLPYFGYL